MLRKTLRGVIAACTAAALLMGGAVAASAEDGAATGENTVSAIEPQNIEQVLDAQVTPEGPSTRAITKREVVRKFMGAATWDATVQSAFLPASATTPAWLIVPSYINGTVAVLDATTGQAVTTISGFVSGGGIAISPGSTSAEGYVYISESSRVMIWDIAQQKTIASINLGFAPQQLAVIPGSTVGTGTLLITRSGSSVLGVDLETGDTVFDHALPNGYGRAGVIPGADATPTSGSILLLATNDAGNMLRLDIESGAVLNKYNVLPGAGYATNRSLASISGTEVGKERVLASDPISGLAKEYDIGSDSAVTTYKYGPLGTLADSIPALTAIAYDPSADEVFAVLGVGDAAVFDRTSGTKLREFLNASDPQGGVGVTGNDTGTGDAKVYVASRLQPHVNIYDSVSDVLVGRIKLSAPADASTVVLGDSPRLIVYYASSSRMEYRDLNTGQVLRTTNSARADHMTPVPLELTGGVSKLLVTNTSAKTIRLVDVESGVVEWTSPVLGFTPEGTAVGVGATAADSVIYIASSSKKSVEVLNWETRDTVRSLPWPYNVGYGTPKYVAVLPGGELGIATSGSAGNGSVFAVANSITGDTQGMDGFADIAGFYPAGIASSLDARTGAVQIYIPDQFIGMVRFTVQGITIDPSTVPNGVVGEAYSAEINAHGTPLPTMKLTGDFPAGLVFDETTGEITGTPTETGEFTFTVTAANGAAPEVSKTYTLFVGVRPVITTDTLPNGNVGAAYTAQVEATGIDAPALSITDGALPAGLTFNETTGAITGTPSVEGSFTIEVTATNRVGSASKEFTFTIGGAVTPSTEAPVITTKTLPNGTVGKTYTAQLEATGVEAPTLALSGGKLPAGLKFDAASGKITGTPSEAGTFKVAFTATNSVGKDSKEFTFTIAPAAVVKTAPVITTKSLPGGTVGKSYTAQVKATGVEAPTLSLSGGALPAGLKFDAKTGKITGTPSKAGTYTIEVTATNSVGKDSKKFTLTITRTTKVLPCMEPRKIPVFSDTPLQHKFYKEIDWMECMKYATGWRMPVGKPEYRPQLNIERQAMAAFIFRMEAEKNYKAPKVSPFADVKTTDTFYRQIAWMWEKGYATGWAEPAGKPTFRSLQPLSREAMAAFIYRLEASTHESARKYKAPKVSPLKDMKPGMKFYKEISWMYSEGLTTGNKTATGKEYWPKDQLSRQAMAAFIYRLVTDYRQNDE